MQTHTEQNTFSVLLGAWNWAGAWNQKKVGIQSLSTLNLIGEINVGKYSRGDIRNLYTETGHIKSS